MTVSGTFYRGETLTASDLNTALAEHIVRTGDTMQGLLRLAQDPVNAFDAATKQYVDRFTAMGVPTGAYIGALPPGNTLAPLWWDTINGQLYIQYNDGTSTQWVSANSGQGSSSSSSTVIIYARDYGAKSDGVTDDSSAINSAIAAAIARGGGMVLLSAGRSLAASPIAANIPATVSITIAGLGADVSELYFSNATDGLNFTLAYVASPRSWAGIHLRGFSVTRGPTSPVTANTGIRIAKADDLAPLYQGTSSLRDLLVQGSSGYAATNGWNIGILVAAVGGITIDSVWLLGANPASPTVADRGDSLMTIMGGPYVEGPTPARQSPPTGGTWRRSLCRTAICSGVPAVSASVTTCRASSSPTPR